jgi:hypothetical protein
MLLHRCGSKRMQLPIQRWGRGDVRELVERLLQALGD